VFKWVAYGELTEALNDLASPLNSSFGRNHCNVLLVREEDLCRAHPEERHAVVSKRKQKQKAGTVSSSTAADAFVEALAKSCTHCSTPTLLFLLPGPPHALIEHSVVETTIRARLEVGELQNLHFFGVRELTKHLPAAYHSPRLERLAHSPFTSEALMCLAPLLCRHVLRVRAIPRKLIVLDCDNTLWGGAVGELGSKGVILSRRFLQCQRFFHEQQRRGVLLALCSRNEETDVMRVWADRATEMALPLSAIVCWRINQSGQSKAVMIQQIAVLYSKCTPTRSNAQLIPLLNDYSYCTPTRSDVHKIPLLNDSSCCTPTALLLHSYCRRSCHWDSIQVSGLQVNTVYEIHTMTDLCLSTHQ
jgi:hypothetical protein